jgi:solute carrier family 25 uncoupling protein 27
VQVCVLAGGLGERLLSQFPMASTPSSKQAPPVASPGNVSHGQRLVLTAASAAVAECFTFPLDILKTQLQLSIGKTSTLQLVKNFVQSHGITGVYSGLTPAVLRHCVYSSIRISVYEELRNHAMKSGDAPRKNISLGEKALFGASAGAIGQFFASPTDLIKIRMQKDPKQYKNVVQAFNIILAERGVQGLWKGVLPNVQRAALVNLGELAAYDSAKQWLIGDKGLKDTLSTHVFSSIISGFVSSVVSTPADVIKSRMMSLDADHLYRGSIDCLVKTVRAEGYNALYKGFFPTWARQGPWQLVFWVSYEQFRKATGMASF